MIYESLNEKKNKMPVLFAGHGSPYNAIEENSYTFAWRNIAQSIPKPEAILVISAHWTTDGTGVTAMKLPQTIHDFEEGFPDELFLVQYPALGSPTLALRIKEKISKTNIILVKFQWGLDHGAWAVLRHMYPEADIPVLELSLDYYRPAAYHYELAKELAFLREEGVLIMATGNIVHNYTKADFYNPSGAYKWAKNFDRYVKQMIMEGNHQALINYRDFGEDALESVPTPEHYFPLLYALAVCDKADKASFPVEDIIFGCLSMRTVLFK
jgi:4,5-DOPA dioxygenase extradiol